MHVIGWGVLILWWGICFLPGVLPNGVDAAGTGIILLAACVIQWARGKSANLFNLIAGVLAVVWGALDMSRSILHLGWRPPVLAILLIVLGIELLGVALTRMQKREALGERSGEEARPQV
jgi:intracellular septation protein A